ncbi:MAG TPA: YihY/virulence factor BrkB family protein [Polyangiaceae bacterium]|nr:YihY/virulence factor BrkB family protein [Polyangiaceae bacterium]
MKAKTWWSILKETGTDWLDDNAARLAAALSYYTLLSIAPLLIIAVTLASLAFGDEAARAGISSEMAAIVGEQAAQSVQAILSQNQAPEVGVVSSIVGIVVLLFGASGVFGELQAALNTVWEVQSKPGRGIWGLIKDRFFSFTMVLGVGFLLLVSLLLSAGLSAVGRFLGELLPGGEALWQALNFVISLGVVTGLFALIFKVVPDVKIEWRNVWIGAVVTALLFTLGKFLLGLYLGKATFASMYGAAGSLVVLVVWVYYSAQILFLGAEFTQVYARHYGSNIRPSANAVPLRSAQTS